MDYLATLQKRVIEISAEIQKCTQHVVQLNGHLNEATHQVNQYHRFLNEASNDESVPQGENDGEEKLDPESN